RREQALPLAPGRGRAAQRQGGQAGPIVEAAAGVAPAQVGSQALLLGGRQLAGHGAQDAAAVEPQAHEPTTSPRTARSSGSVAARASSFMRRYLHRRAVIPRARATSSWGRSSTSDSLSTPASSGASPAEKWASASRTRAARTSASGSEGAARSSSSRLSRASGRRPRARRISRQRFTATARSQPPSGPRAGSKA